MTTKKDAGPLARKAPGVVWAHWSALYPATATGGRSNILAFWFLVSTSPYTQSTTATLFLS